LEPRNDNAGAVTTGTNFKIAERVCLRIPPGMLLNSCNRMRGELLDARRAAQSRAFHPFVTALQSFKVRADIPNRDEMIFVILWWAKRATSPEQRALCRLLSYLVGSYIEAFDEEHLPVAIADRAYQRLLDLVASLDFRQRGPPPRRSTTVRCLRSRVQVLAFRCKPQVCGWVHVVAGMVNAGFECGGGAGRGYQC
jgi:hypothetical protein